MIPREAMAPAIRRRPAGAKAPSGPARRASGASRLKARLGFKRVPSPGRIMRDTDDPACGFLLGEFAPSGVMPQRAGLAAPACLDPLTDRHPPIVPAAFRKLDAVAVQAASLAARLGRCGRLSRTIGLGREKPRRFYQR